MKSFIEREIINDGNVSIYDIYSIMRPDIDKYYDEIIHYDARFIIKEPYGYERKLINIKGDSNTKPISELKLSARDRVIEEYLAGKISCPRGFSKRELNSNNRINGFKVYSDNLYENALKVGNVMFGISGKWNKSDVKKIYERKWKNGPEYPPKELVHTTKKNMYNIEKMFFCLDLWIMTSFYGFKASSTIRIVDLDLMKKGDPIFRNWKRIYKDFKTQDIILELE